MRGSASEPILLGRAANKSQLDDDVNELASEQPRLAGFFVRDQAGLRCSSGLCRAKNKNTPHKTMERRSLPQQLACNLLEAERSLKGFGLLL